MTTSATTTDLDAMHHVAIAVDDIAAAIEWYRANFRCEVAYQDATWGMLTFSNMQLALVTKSQHPPHIAFSSTQAEKFGPLKAHRDGTRSTYIADPSGNPVEIMAIDAP
ncbi:MAG: VOC family protein [Planctomycetota bacterium]|nr:VOC family protein [Planctomycetota bacterium]